LARFIHRRPRIIKNNPPILGGALSIAVESVLKKVLEIC